MKTGYQTEMIKSIFKKSFSWIEDKKKWFVLLFFTQLIYVGLMLFVVVVYFLKIMSHADVLLESISSITEEEIMSNSISHPLGLYSHYQSFLSAVVVMIVLSCVIYLLLNNVNWSITNKVVNRGKFLGFFSKYIIFTLIFTVPLFFIAWGMLRLITITTLQTFFLSLLGVIVLVFWYFMCISFGLIHKYKLKQIKEHLIKTFYIGCKKAYVLVPITVFIVALLGVIGYLIYLASDIFPLMVVFIVLFILALVWTRILCMAATKEVIK